MSEFERIDFVEGQGFGVTDFHRRPGFLSSRTGKKQGNRSVPLGYSFCLRSLAASCQLSSVPYAQRP
jgi:hypothetical protein